MKQSFRSFALLFSALIFIPASHAQENPGFTFRVDVKLKQTWASITDGKQNTIDPQVAAEKCAVYEGKDKQTLSKVITGDGRFATILVVDHSSSMWSFLPALAEDARKFAERSVEAGNIAETAAYSGTGIISRSGMLSLAPNETKTSKEQESAFVYGINGDRHNHMDALSANLMKLAESDLMKLPNHLVKSIVLFTDGGDYESNHLFDQMLDEMKQLHIRVNVIHLKPEEVFRGHMVSKSQLKQLASETGGAYAFIQHAEDADAAFDKMSDIFQSSLLFLYNPTRTDQQTTVKCPGGYNVQLLNWSDGK